jgi:hypothetical protein
VLYQKKAARFGRKNSIQFFTLSVQILGASFQSAAAGIFQNYICILNRSNMKNTMALLLLAGSAFINTAMAQTAEKEAKDEPLSFGLFEGTAVAGYVDHGGFLNFTGPNVSYAFGKSKVLAGMLPSLRFKDDKSAVRNAFVTPTLGVGITYSHKKWAVQVPLYYNAKTATVNGKWNVGIGIGMKLK